MRIQISHSRLTLTLSLLRPIIPSVHIPRRRGEIGRHDRLKICCPQGRVGSSPTAGRLSNLPSYILSLSSSLCSTGLVREDLKSPIGKECESRDQACLGMTEPTRPRLNGPTKLVHSLPPVNYLIFRVIFFHSLVLFALRD